MACLAVCVTNTGLNADKRGVAVEFAKRLALATIEPVCLVGADPTDRDVERHLPQLRTTAGEYSRTQLTRGPHTLDLTYLPDHRLYAVTVSDRAVVHEVFPALRDAFGFLVVDGPSRVGAGVGIAHVLLNYVDLLLVTTNPSAAELARSRVYLASLESHPMAHNVDVGVVMSGHPDDSGLSRGQLEQRSRALPIIGWLPHLWGRPRQRVDSEQLDVAFRPILSWIVGHRNEEPAPTVAAGVRSSERHVVHARYRADNL